MATITSTNLDLSNLPVTPVASLAKGQSAFADYAAQEMALVHNALIRGWNSIYQQAPRIIKKDQRDFIEYALIWYKILELHHDGEETDLYPKMEQCMESPGFFSPAVNEHGAFHDGLDRYNAYLTECKQDPDKFSGEKLVEIMNSFGEALYLHMGAEPELLLTIQGFDDVTLRKIWDNHTKEILGSASPFSLIPVMWVNFDATYEDGKWASFPEIPAPIKFYMKFIASRWNSQWWRFGSTTYGGQPQTLLALRDGYGK